MQIPAAFRVTDTEILCQFIRKHSFALVTSVGDSADAPPVATHLPLLLETHNSEPARLLGHFARANPQWQACNDRRVLAIFSGPHAYISAGWYGEKDVVPTWNYVAVHITGRLQIIEDSEQLLQIVEQTVSTYEQGTPTPWNLASTDREYPQGMLHGIVGFAIEIETVDGCWKLNQHHSESRRTGAVSGLLQRRQGEDAEIAALTVQSAPK